jgi:hypothetical protein
LSLRQSHRVAVVNKQGELVSILTQSRVVKFLSDHIENFAVGNETVKELNLGTDDVLKVKLKGKSIDMSYRRR